MRSRPTVLHVINHTHWDREWFVPFNISRTWIPTLIRNLQKVVEHNPDYNFLFDAQTAVIEDLKAADKTTYDIARRLIRDHRLSIGPYYGQLEMRLSGPESLIRNLRIGTTTARDLGASTDFTAWDVDSFGHVSQSPQIHALFGIHNVFLWRGPYELEPFFWWDGPDNSRMLAIDLFAGGYRNFYRVDTIDELAMPRLQYEVRKLRPFYPSGHIPVFDGFDLDKEPGDTATYFSQRHHDELSRDHVKVVNSSPLEFAKTVRQSGDQYPTLKGELISGKYSSVYPGLLSTRTYSKLVCAYAEQLLYRYAEPLSLLQPSDQYPEQFFEEQTKLVLQNLVHDVISGCSIDQIHDTAEIRAADLGDALKTQVTTALESAAGNLADGTYAFLPTTGATNMSLEVKDRVYRVRGQGAGLVPVEQSQPLRQTAREVKHFRWENPHYTATLKHDGTVHLGGGRFGQIVTRPDEGDTYWDEPRGDATVMKITSPITITRETDGFAQLQFTAQAKTNDYTADAVVTVTFDQSPLVKWRLKLETTGIGFGVALRQAYNRRQSHLNVGMQFDNVTRSFEDTDLLDRELEPKLAPVVIAQRDITRTFTFPFQNYISPADNPDRVHLLAKGLRAYQTEQPGTIDLILSRPVEWVMKPGFHKYHTGDAGPKYLVPGARSERTTTIECGLLVHDAGPDTANFHQLVDQFMNPPLLFTVNGSCGSKTSMELFDSPAPITALHQFKGQRLARTYNPTSHPINLDHDHTLLSADEKPAGSTKALRPKQIATVTLPRTSPAVAKAPAPAASSTAPTVVLLNWPHYPAGPDHSKASRESLVELRNNQKRLKSEHDSLRDIIAAYGDNAPHALLHRYYVISREYMEANLSLRWNEMRSRGIKPDKNYAYPIPSDLLKMATEYNDMRIIRRMYDYIVGISVDGVVETGHKAYAAPMNDI